MRAQSRHKNAPALDFARECGIILLKGNAVYSGQTFFIKSAFLDDDRLEATQAVIAHLRQITPLDNMRSCGIIKIQKGNAVYSGQTFTKSIIVSH